MDHENLNINSMCKIIEKDVGKVIVRRLSGECKIFISEEFHNQFSMEFFECSPAYRFVQVLRPLTPQIADKRIEASFIKYLANRNNTYLKDVPKEILKIAKITVKKAKYIEKWDYEIMLKWWEYREKPNLEYLVKYLNRWEILKLRELDREPILEKYTQEEIEKLQRFHQEELVKLDKIHEKNFHGPIRNLKAGHC